VRRKDLRREWPSKPPFIKASLRRAGRKGGRREERKEGRKERRKDGKVGKRKEGRKEEGMKER
jgi:hypothetical protein